MKYLDRKIGINTWEQIMDISEDLHELTERGLSLNEEGEVENDQSLYPGDIFRLTEG